MPRPACPSFTPPLRLELDEIGWQVAILPGLAGLYTGTETIPTIDEATQAGYYADAITAAECDPTVSSLSFFLLLDEPQLSHWQSGLERLDGSHRPSYDTVKQVIADTDGNCRGSLVSWTHTGGLVASRVTWGDLRRKRTTRTTRWSFAAGAKEEAVFRAGIFKAGTTRHTIAAQLVRGNPKAVLAVVGKIKAKNRVVAFPARKLKNGRYVFAIRMQATMNPARVTIVVSSAFRVERTAQMTDPRLARLAELIAGYSLELEPGKILRIDTSAVAVPLATELYRAALRAGAYAYVNVDLEELTELLVREGTDEQIEFISPVAETEIDRVDAIVTIWAEENTRALEQRAARAAPASDRRDPAADPAALGADLGRRAALVRRALPDCGARPGRRHVAAGVRAVRLSRLPRRGGR